MLRMAPFAVRVRSLALVVTLVAGGAGCTSLLGDFSSGPGADGGAGDSTAAEGGEGGEESGVDATMETGPGPEAGPDGLLRDTGTDVVVADAPRDVVGDAPKETGPTCGPTSCPMGCCDTTGACVPYTAQSSSECGNGGLACGACASGDSCSSGACSCGGGACTGCCSSTGSCVTPSSVACGSNGAACTMCASGQECVSGSCVCDAASCPTGCCDSSGHCVTSGQSSCGTGGVACVACQTGQACNSSGQCVCDGNSCAGGCCTGSVGGTCVTFANETGSQCGNSGGTCGSCGNGLCDKTNGSCACDSNTCPGGCCSGGSSGTCEAASSQSTSSCGTGGAACAACSPASGGTVSCANGACECNGAAGCAAGATCCSAGCANLQTDPNNCGTCGHGCLGGACSGGQCQPILLATLSDQTMGIAVSPSKVFFTDPAHAFACPLTGCTGTPSPLYTETVTNPSLVAVMYDPTFQDLKLAEDNSSDIYDVSISNGAVNWENSGIGIANPLGLTQDLNNVYWAQYNGVAYTQLAGGSTTQLCNFTFNQYVRNVTYDNGTNSVFGAVEGTSGGYVVQCPVGGGSTTTYGPLEPDVYDITAVGNHVYYVILGTAPARADGGLFVSADTALTTRTTLATGSAYGDAVALTADLNNVYFAAGNSGKIYKCATNGCGGAPTAVATASGVNHMVNDTTAIYWTAGDTVMKLAK